MTEYIPIPEMKVKIKDAFSFDDVPRILEEWFMENGYKDAEGNDDPETLQTYKIAKGGKFLEVWLWWRCIKYPPGSNEKNAYVRYKINLDVQYLGNAVPEIVMHKGKKVKMYKGTIEFMITPIIEMDFRNEWGKKGLKGMMHRYFRERIYKMDIEKHFQLLYVEAYKLQSMIKQWFGLPAMMPTETVSQPPSGLLP